MKVSPIVGHTFYTRDKKLAIVYSSFKQGDSEFFKAVIVDDNILRAYESDGTAYGRCTDADLVEDLGKTKRLVSTKRVK